MTIYIDLLRQALKNELQGAFYGSEKKFGGALLESFQIDDMTDDQVIELALRYGFRLENYQVEDQQKRR